MIQPNKNLKSFLKIVVPWKSTEINYHKLFLCPNSYELFDPSINDTCICVLEPSQGAAGAQELASSHTHPCKKLLGSFFHLRVNIFSILLSPDLKIDHFWMNHYLATKVKICWLILDLFGTFLGPFSDLSRTFRTFLGPFSDLFGTFLGLLHKHNRIWKKYKATHKKWTNHLQQLLVS